MTDSSASMSGTDEWKIQADLFAAVLDMIQETTPPKEDLINEVIEVHLAEEGGGFEIVRYPLPEGQS